MTRTEAKTTGETRTTKTATRTRCIQATDCHCGQQLDMCVRAHCPRCGRSINQH